MILLTGASGLLGSAVASCLHDEGRDVLAPSRGDVDLLDAADTRAFFETHRPEAVIHCAARVHGLMGNKRFPAEMFDDNLLMNFNVVAACRHAGVRKIVAVSTVAAYPGHLVHDIREEQFFDGRPHDGENGYAHAKRAMLAQLMNYHAQYGLDYAYPICTNLYGPGDRFDAVNGHVIPSLVAKFHAAASDATGNGGSVEVWGRGRAKRDFMYRADAAAALVHCLDHVDGPVTLATGETVPIARAVEVLAEVSGVSDVRWDPDKPEGQLDRSYDVSKLRDSGFTSSHSLEEGLRETYGWYARNYPDVRV